MEYLTRLDKDLIVVHYDRTAFGELSDTVFELYLYDATTDNFTSFEFNNSQYTEAEAIQAFATAVSQATEKGKVVVSWNQNRPHFGPQHLNKRYKYLTGNELDLHYGETSINLAGVLYDMHGNDYVDHPRLDNLAILNDFLPESGHFKRIGLIVKILFATLEGRLKIKTDALRELEKKQETIYRLKADLKLVQSDDKVLDRAEVIELLGISERTLVYWVKNNQIPYTRIGRRLYFLESQIIAHLKK